MIDDFIWWGKGGEWNITVIETSWLCMGDRAKLDFFFPAFWPLNANINVSDIDFCLDHKETCVFSVAGFIFICWTSLLYFHGYHYHVAKLNYSLWKRSGQGYNCILQYSIQWFTQIKGIIKTISVYILKESKVKCSS